MNSNADWQSRPPAAPEQALADLAAAINAAHERAQARPKDRMTHAREAGRLLIQAKSLVRHGQWLRWLKANVTFTPQTAAFYCRHHRARLPKEGSPPRLYAPNSQGQARSEQAEPMAVEDPQRKEQIQCACRHAALALATAAEALGWKDVDARLEMVRRIKATATELLTMAQEILETTQLG